jgi:hypothetical protein
VEKDKKALLQSYQSLGQTALDHSKDKFLVQSCAVSAQFVQDYSQGDEGYDKLSTLWSSNVGSTTNKKLNVRHVVSATSQIDLKAATPTPAAVPIDNMSQEQLQAEVNNLRRKYDELVAFSVNLTAERDILNNTLEQTKRDLNRELTKNSSTGTRDVAKGKTTSSSSTGSKMLMAIVALFFFGAGVRLEARGQLGILKSLPFVGPILEEPSLVEEREEL